ncbi:MAG: toll/interleukin-1 receptor domain-containing protein [Rhizobiaceae bacterium]
MASLYEYFVKDGSRNLATHETWSLIDGKNGAELGKVIAKLHYDFEANAKFISFYIPNIDGIELPETLLLNRIDEILKWPKEKVEVSAGFGSERRNAKDLVFTGQIYLYSERPVRPNYVDQILADAQRLGQNITFRSVDYALARSKSENPDAFISHDSRDKDLIAEPLALQFQKFMRTVWYDEFSLQVGDSLRESIERGLTESKKCIIILTRNFLENTGWSKREYDSIFTRELVEKKKVILPVWSGVSPNDIYRFSPMLADRVAANWSDGVEEVARRLIRAIDSTVPNSDL